IDPLLRRVAVDVESYSYDFETFGIEFVAQGLPHGQVKPASSPRRPRDDQRFLAAQRGERELVALVIGEGEVGRLRRRERAPERFGTERPHSRVRIVDERHAEAIGEHLRLEGVGLGAVDRQRNTYVALACALGLERPAGATLEIRAVDFGR